MRHNDPIKIAIVYRMDHPGGVQSCVLALIKGLNRIDITPTIVWDVEPDWSMLQRTGVIAQFYHKKFPIPTRILDRLPTPMRNFLRIFNLVKMDLSQDQSYDFYYIFDNGFIPPVGKPHLRYLSGPPLLPQIKIFSPGLRGFPSRFINWIYNRFLSESHPVYEYHHNSSYIINSLYTAALFKDAHEVSLPVVHPPINITGLTYKDNDIRHRDTITFFSRVVDYKRPDQFIRLISKYPQSRAVLMGGVPTHRMAYFEKLKKMALSLEINNLIFIANPSSQRVKEELIRTKFFVFPAINEHFGMTTVEAIASGAIPFVHDSGGQREIVIYPKLRFDDPQFFEKFEKLYRCSLDELQILREHLYDHIQQYSEESYIEKMLSYLPQIFPSTL